MAQPTTTHPDQPPTLPAVQSLRGAAAIQQIIAHHLLELADTLGPIPVDQVHTSLASGVWAIDLPAADQARALASRLALTHQRGVGGSFHQVWTGTYADHRIRVSGSGQLTTPVKALAGPVPAQLVPAGVTARWTVTAPGLNDVPDLVVDCRQKALPGQAREVNRAALAHLMTHAEGISRVDLDLIAHTGSVQQWGRIVSDLYLVRDYPLIPDGHGLCFSCGLIVPGIEATSPCEACAATSRRLATEEAGSNEATFEQLVRGGQR